MQTKIIIYTLFVFLVSFNLTLAQVDIEHLEQIKSNLQDQVTELNDSIAVIKKQIKLIKNKEIKTNASNNGIIATIKEGGFIQDKPHLLGDVLAKFDSEREITVFDFEEDFYSVCADSICGFINKRWVWENNDTLKLINQYKDKQKKMSEAEYIKKFGPDTYSRIKRGELWIGMTKSMAEVSKGKPKEINRTITSSGVHEQWVYDNYVYLYFEDGLLTTIQN